MRRVLRFGVSALVASLFIAQGKDCVEGTLKDYLGNKCTVKDVSFEFPADGIGVSLVGIDTGKVTVKPLPATRSLSFEFPELDPQNGLVAFIEKVTAATKFNPIADAKLEFAEKGFDATVIEDLQYTDGMKTKASSLRVTKLFKAMEGIFAKLVPLDSVITARFVITPNAKTAAAFTNGFSLKN